MTKRKNKDKKDIYIYIYKQKNQILKKKILQNFRNKSLGKL